VDFQAFLAFDAKCGQGQDFQALEGYVLGTTIANSVSIPFNLKNSLLNHSQLISLPAGKLKSHFPSFQTGCQIYFIAEGDVVDGSL
jgi:hypothetical protein